MAAQEPGWAFRPGQGAPALRRRLGEDFLLRTVSQPGGESDLAFRHALQALGEVRLHTVGLPPCRLELSCATGLCLALPLAGEVTLRPTRRGGRPLAADAGHTAVLLPGGPLLLRCDRWIEVVLIGLPRPALEAALGPWLAPPAPPQTRRRVEARLERGVQWRESEPLAGPLLALLHQTVRLLERAAQLPGDGAALPNAALQDCLLRPLSLLLLQDPAADGAPADRVDPSRRFEALLAHIEANLHRPLCLRDLSEHSGCSPRALQYAFERRFGCGPMQWVRQQRLEAAAQALRQSASHEPIQQIARRCGYTNLSSFSRDIQRNFGLPPSALRLGPDLGTGLNRGRRPDLRRSPGRD
jgi:AraC-like DNA-binding protein